jgi:hypothetical protein
VTDEVLEAWLKKAIPESKPENEGEHPEVAPAEEKDEDKVSQNKPQKKRMIAN